MKAALFLVLTIGAGAAFAAAEGDGAESDPELDWVVEMLSEAREEIRELLVRKRARGGRQNSLAVLAVSEMRVEGEDGNRKVR